MFMIVLVVNTASGYELIDYRVFGHLRVCALLFLNLSLLVVIQVVLCEQDVSCYIS